MTQNKLKICHLITRMIVGGAQENTLFSCRGQIENGHNVVLATGPTSGPEGKLLDKQKVPGLEVKNFSSLLREISPINDFKAYRQLKKYFKDEKFDVVHTHSSKAGIIGRAAAWAAKVPAVIHTVHGPAFHRYEKPWRNKLYIAAEKLAAKRCHKIVCVADAMTNQFLEAGVSSPEMYQTVYSGMNLDDYLTLSDDKSMRKQLGIPADAIVIGKIARLFELKGHVYLIKAAREIIKEFPNAHFLWLGDGLLKESLMSDIKLYGLEKNFHLPGLVPPDEVPKYVQLMDIVCHLSLREGLPRAVVQGLAASKPAVSYHLDGAPEVIINGKTGYTCPAESVDEVIEALKLLIESESHRQKLGEQGRELVRSKFDWLKMCSDLEKIYFEVLNR
jgi:glycosyltransferase involved in cell wall biosynthesis